MDETANRLWYTQPSPVWDDMNMLIRPATNISNGTSIVINRPVAVHFITRHFPHVHVLQCNPQGSIRKVSDEIVSPMINVRQFFFHGLHQGVEHLFDPQLLPNLRCIRTDCSCLFSALMRMSSNFPALSQLNHIERLELTEKRETFALKQWYTIIDGFPRLQSLYLYFLSVRCPPKIWIDVLIDSIQRSKMNKLVLLSVYMYIDQNDHEKTHFMRHFIETIRRKHPGVYLIDWSNATFDAWF
jgi:hypothetical protein